MADRQYNVVKEYPDASLFEISVVGRSIHATERRLFTICLIAVAIGIIVFLLLSPPLWAVFLEYVIKFVPVYSDRGLASIFDGFLVGDPRGRVVANLFGYINIAVRQQLLELGPIHPTLSISWLLYPAILAVFWLAVRKLTRSWRAAAMAVVLLAFSPAMLDFFVDYFIPAKPLILFFFVSALLGAAQIAAAGEYQTDRAYVGAALVAVSLLLGLLSDETGIFIALCIPLMFLGWFLSPRTSSRDRLLFVGAFGCGAVLFAAALLVIIPAINHSLGQTLLDMPTLVFKGVYQTMFGYESISLASLIWHQYSPQGLVKTILSAHLIPLRRVVAVWTGPRLDPWKPWELLPAMIICAFWFDCLFRAPVEAMKKTWWILAAFTLFIFFQAVLILRLAPNITEVNYYANLSSVFIALLIAIPMATWAGESTRRIKVAWIAVAVIAVIEFSNFVATAGRHPMFLNDPKPLSWKVVKDGYDEARNGHFADFARTHPFPTRPFVWALEAALAERKTKGLSADIRPFDLAPSTPLSLVNFSKLIDPKVPILPAPPLATESDLQAAGAKPVAASQVMDLRNHELRGRFGVWELRWRQTSSGVDQQAWRGGLMRLWSERGTQPDRATCPRFPFDNVPCPDRYYALGELFFGVYSDGTVKLVLKPEQLSR